MGFGEAMDDNLFGRSKGDKKGKGDSADSFQSPRKSDVVKKREVVWHEDLYRPAFCEDPWEELYALHSAAYHLRAHLERDTRKEADMAEEKAAAEADAAAAAKEKEKAAEAEKATSIYDFFQ